MAKEKDQLKEDVKEQTLTPPAATVNTLPPTTAGMQTPASPKALSGAERLRQIASEDPVMAALLERLDNQEKLLNAQSAELSMLKGQVPQKTATPTIKDNGLVVTLPMTSPIPTGMVRHKVEVRLKHGRTCQMPIDILPGQEMFIRDAAIKAYNAFFGIISTEHVHETVDCGIVNPESVEVRTEAKAA